MKTTTHTALPEDILSAMSGQSSAPSTSASASDVPAPVNKHLPSAVELQRQQLARLLKDPDKPVVIPKAPKEKTLRPPREMMKNVQGSSAGVSLFLFRGMYLVPYSCIYFA